MAERCPHHHQCGFVVWLAYIQNTHTNDIASCGKSNQLWCPRINPAGIGFANRDIEKPLGDSELQIVKKLLKI